MLVPNMNNDVYLLFSFLLSLFHCPNSTIFPAFFFFLTLYIRNAVCDSVQERDLGTPCASPAHGPGPAQCYPALASWLRGHAMPSVTSQCHRVLGDTGAIVIIFSVVYNMCTEMPLIWVSPWIWRPWWSVSVVQNQHWFYVFRGDFVGRSYQNESHTSFLPSLCPIFSFAYENFPELHTPAFLGYSTFYPHVIFIYYCIKLVNILFRIFTCTLKNEVSLPVFRIKIILALQNRLNNKCSYVFWKTLCKIRFLIKLTVKILGSGFGRGGRERLWIT